MQRRAIVVGALFLTVVTPSGAKSDTSCNGVVDCGCVVEKGELNPDGGTHVTPDDDAICPNVTVLAEHIDQVCPDSSASQPALGATPA